MNTASGGRRLPPIISCPDCNAPMSSAWVATIGPKCYRCLRRDNGGRQLFTNQRRGEPSANKQRQERQRASEYLIR